ATACSCRHRRPDRAPERGAGAAGQSPGRPRRDRAGAGGARARGFRRRAGPGRLRRDLRAVRPGRPGGLRPGGLRARAARRVGHVRADHRAGRSVPALPDQPARRRLRLAGERGGRAPADAAAGAAGGRAERIPGRTPGLGEEGGMSFLDDFVGYLQTRTDAPSDFHVHAGMVALSTAVGNRVWTHGWTRPVYPNLWAVVIAPSGYGKSAPLDMAERVLRKAQI